MAMSGCNACVEAIALQSAIHAAGLFCTKEEPCRSDRLKFVPIASKAFQITNCPS
jgi:hypothetical protein